MNRLFLRACRVARGRRLLACAACNSVDSGTIQIITDQEAGTFSESPALTELQVAAVESADASTILATAQLPTSTIDLGQQSESAPVVSLNITGSIQQDPPRLRRLPRRSSTPRWRGKRSRSSCNARGSSRASRASVGLEARARARGGPGRVSPRRGWERLVARETTQIFDFGQFAPFDAPPTLPVVPESIALSGTVAWLINATAARTTTSRAPAPPRPFRRPTADRSPTWPGGRPSSIRTARSTSSAARARRPTRRWCSRSTRTTRATRATRTATRRGSSSPARASARARRGSASTSSSRAAARPGLARKSSIRTSAAAPRLRRRPTPRSAWAPPRWTRSTCCSRAAPCPRSKIRAYASSISAARHPRPRPA